MIRTFLEFLLNRTLDDGTQETGWFRRLLLRDARLSRFDSETRQLDMLLRNTATEQRQTLASDNSTNAAELTLSPQRQSPQTAHAKKQGHSLAWLSGMAVAAVLLIVLLPNWLRPTTTKVHAGNFSQQLTVVPGEVLRLLTRAAKTSQTQLPQLSPLAKLSLPAMSAWEEVALHVESPVRQEINFWQESWQNFRLRLPSASQKVPQEL